MNNFEWIKDYYKVPAQFGRDVIVGGKLGTITEDMGTYIGVVFEGKHHAAPCHPTSEVVYLETFNSVHPVKISRSAQRYRDYIQSDSSLTFSEWLGIKPKKRLTKIDKQCVHCLGSHGFHDERKCQTCHNYMCSYCEQFCPMC